MFFWLANIFFLELKTDFDYLMCLILEKSRFKPQPEELNGGIWNTWASGLDSISKSAHIYWFFSYMEKNTSKWEVIINFVWSESPCWTKQDVDTNNTWLEEMCWLRTGNTKLNLLCTALQPSEFYLQSKWRISLLTVVQYVHALYLKN